MTAEEAIKILEVAKAECEWNAPLEYQAAFDMAIEALRKSTGTSDLISRQELCEYALNQKDKSVTPNDIMRFPSAQPEQRASLLRALQITINYLDECGGSSYLITPDGGTISDVDVGYMHEGLEKLRDYLAKGGQNDQRKSN